MLHNCSQLLPFTVFFNIVLSFWFKCGKILTQCRDSSLPTQWRRNTYCIVYLLVVQLTLTFGWIWSSSKHTTPHQHQHSNNIPDIGSDRKPCLRSWCCCRPAVAAWCSLTSESAMPLCTYPLYNAVVHIDILTWKHRQKTENRQQTTERLWCNMARMPTLTWPIHQTKPNLPLNVYV